MKKNVILASLFVIILAFSLVPALAQESHQDLTNGLGTWGYFQYLNAKGFFVFSTAGSERHCGENQPSKCEGNPLWCGQPDEVFDKPQGYSLTKNEVMQNCPTDRNKGAFLDIYYYNGNFNEIDMTNRNSYTLSSSGASIETYCCECYESCARECEDGEKQQFVCNPQYPSRLYYSYCNNGKWEDQYDTCSSGKSCVQTSGGASCKTTECQAGNIRCGQSDGSDLKRYFTCSAGSWKDNGYVDGHCGYSSNECPSGQTRCDDGTCKTDCGGTPIKAGKTIIASDYQDATATMWIKALCKETSDCSKVESTEANYTVKCTADTKYVNQAESKVEVTYGDCIDCLNNQPKSFWDALYKGISNLNLFGNLKNFWNILIVGDLSKYGICETKCNALKPYLGQFNNGIEGVCIAEEKGSGQFCVQGLSDIVNKYITHKDDCQTNTIYAVVGIIILLIIFMALLRGGK